MGCGGSRMGGAEGEAVPAGIRPLLRRRLGGVKKRSQASVLKGNQTLSKKELLRHRIGSSDGEETEHDVSMRSAKVAPAPDHDEVNNNNMEVVYEEVEEKIIEVVKEGEVDHHDGHGHGHVCHDGCDVHGDDYHHEEEEGELEKDDDEEEGRMSNFDERMICPASPSFRVYCIHLSDSDDEFEDKDGEEKKKSSQTENGAIDDVEPKDQSMERVRKAKKGQRRFRISLPKSAKRKKCHLFNVTAPCYSAVVARGCMGNNHPNPRLAHEKPSTH
ncbi:PREDICTED: uncharacterized protein LOC104811564 [Tarenaya hassleriana]|uniref:uncharacterized protein LOC104811564 n=1 Tax=Tarenaya hassleriana TaxID=28532 RepID=UPI00053CA1FC|nr:PREDICTED: uncharacterized protein LOC104811564 [Tarenaya hassleriana]